jgi:xanthine dehydrogenase accessory factor
MDDLSQLLTFRDQCRAANTPLLLVTVVRAAGSTYRKPGARLLLTQDGRHEGTISGGCLEADLVETAWDRVEQTQGQPVITRYDTTAEGEIFWGTGTGCGGQVDLLLELLPADDPLTFVAEGRSAGEEVAFVTVLEHHTSTSGLTRNTPAPGTRFCLRRARSAFPETLHGHFLSEFRRLAENTLAEKQSSIAVCDFPESVGFDVFCEFVPVPPSLFVFGTGRDALPVAQLAKSLGWKVTVAGKRASVGAAVQLEALADAFLTAQDALTHITNDSLVLVMSHNFLDDLSVLESLARSSLRYVGLLGPRARKEKLIAELERTNAGWDRKQLDKLHAPAGLDLGIEGPAGIALSIVAEMQAVLAERSAGQLRLRTAPIYSTSLHCSQILKDL